MISFVLSQLEILLQKLPPDVIKKAIDAALDAVENQLAKDGLTPWEKVAIEGIKYLRKALGVVEEAGSDYEDK